MTRASLLHILDHVNRISDTEVRELEQLAATFPYCQTAHVLLAKAAHDRGSMLASQRLRRAATYAADRELLRQLLEQSSLPSETVLVPDGPAATAGTSATLPLTLPEATPNFTTLSVEAETAEEEVFSAGGTPSSASETETERPAADILSEVLPIPAEQALPAEEEPVTVVTQLMPLPEAAPVDAPVEAPVLVLSAADSPLAELNVEAVPDPPAVALANAPADAPPFTDPDSAAPADEVLPALAPPIRPPAEAGISRFEFGFSKPELPAPSSYQLADLEEEGELPTLASVTPPQPGLAPFRADEDLGYALSAGSRLGYDLQPHDGYTLDLPLDVFFEPDALLLAYIRNNQPKPAASSLDLINRFLKTQPRIKTPAGVPLPAEEQADLSARSTSGAPALASESLAKIMVKQGKKDKAIEIYERLMERQPEKKAYFAEQIQQLQQPSE